MYNDGHGVTNTAISTRIICVQPVLVAVAKSELEGPRERSLGGLCPLRHPRYSRQSFTGVEIYVLSIDFQPVVASWLTK
jgi:hypothetical protein